MRRLTRSRRGARLLALAVTSGVLAVVPGVAHADHGHTVPAGPVYEAWQALGGEDGDLGHATGDHQCGLVRGGCRQAFEYGSVYTTPDGRVQPMRLVLGPAGEAAIVSHWLSLGAEDGPLGYPTQAGDCSAGPCTWTFERGDIRTRQEATRPYFNDDVYEMRDSAITEAWAASGGAEGAYGEPYGAETCTADGCERWFLSGRLFSTPQHGAHPIVDEVDGRTIGFLGEWVTGQDDAGISPLGYPTSSVSCSTSGCAQTFQRGRIVLDLTADHAEPRTVLDGDTEPITVKWLAEGGERGRLGYPVADRVCNGDAGGTFSESGGCRQQFQGGYVYWGPKAGAHTVTNDVHQRYVWTGGDFIYGFPTSDMTCDLPGGGCVQHFTAQTLFVTPQGADRWLHRIVVPRYLALGGPAGRLGYPTDDTHSIVRPIATDTAGPPWMIQDFEGGSLYYSATTGTRLMTGALLTKYEQLGEGIVYGGIGWPTADATCGLKDGGCTQSFQQGRMFWSAKTGAHAVRGSLLSRWSAAGGVNGALGYPVSDEREIVWTKTAQGSVASGWVQKFSGGSVYYSKATGGRLVTGQIGARYAALGGHKALGLPTTDTRCGLRDGGCAQSFQKGDLYWSAKTGAYVVKGSVLTKWLKAGGVNSRYGYPVADQKAIPGGVTQKFSGGTLTYKNGRWV